MNIILLLVCLWPRPDLVPVGRAELGAALALEQNYGIPSVRTPGGSSGPCICVHPSSAVGRHAHLIRSSVVSSLCVLGGSSRIPGQYVVGYEPGCEEQVQAALARAGAEVRRVDRASGFFVCRSATDRLDLTDADGVRYVEPDFRMQASKIPNDPYFLTQQWDKWVMYSDIAWDIATGGSGVKVAVIDNGVEYWHPDLAARFVPGQYGHDFIWDDDDPKPDNPSLPEAFHGTHVSGIVAAVMDNSAGVAGWAQVQLVAVRVLNDSGSGDLSDLASGIRWAVDHGCRVLNMSLGATVSTTPVEEACRYAAQQNAVLFAAAGNAGTGTVQFPAALSECVCIGALDEYSGLADFSNYGPEQELIAPGVSVLSTTVGGSYVQASGTSMACPEVAGVAALILSVDNGLSASRVRAILAASAIDKGLSGRDEYYGYGLVNAARAMQLAVLMGRDSKPTEPAAHGQAVVCRGPLRAPGWADEMTLYDGQGRIAARVGRGQQAEVNPGPYFATLWASGRTERLKLLVLR